MPDTPEFLAARNELHNEIVRRAEGLGPGGVATPLLRCWALVTAWVDAEDGRPYLVGTWSADLAEYERVGMLHEALYEMGNDDE